MRRRRVLSTAVIITSLLVITALAVAQAGAVANTTAVPAGAAEVGKLIFFDENLSLNNNQSCATCHDPAVGWTGPDSAVNAHGAVYEGSIPGAFGNRKPPASAYAGHSPVLECKEGVGWVGGMFWDGRATGATLGDPLAEQAQGPFLNPAEQALPDAAALVAKVRAASYAGQFKAVWGATALDDVAKAYEYIGRSVAAYERSAEVNPYSSKFDKFWDAAKKKGKNPESIVYSGSTSNRNYWTTFRKLGLSDAELQGLAIFADPNRADCASCHSLVAGPDGYPLFTDFTYDNLGIPKNLENPVYDTSPDWIDEGLGGYLESKNIAGWDQEVGKHKVPTLRNVDKRPSTGVVKAYGHNGYFKSLDSIVMFYHWRAMQDGGMMGGGGGMGGGGMGGGGMGGGGMGGMMFGPPEVDENRATLKMFSGMDRQYLVTFLKTLSDGYYTRR